MPPRQVSLRWLLSASATGNTPQDLSDVDTQDALAWFTPEAFSDGGIHLTAPKGFANRKEVRLFPKNSVLAVGIASIGKVALATHDCSGNQQINCLVPGPELDARFLAYALKAQAEKMQADAGISTLPILNQDKMKALRVPYVDLHMQTAIADYLDAKTAAIDALIAKKGLLIEELKKYQEAAIAEAVKPREEWRPYKVKQLFKTLPKSNLPSGVGEAAGSVPFYVSGEDTKRVTDAMHNGAALLLADGGKATLHLAEGAFAWSDHVMCLVSTDSATTEFVYNQLSVQRDLLNAQGFRGTGLPMLDKRWLYEDVPVWLPNSCEEVTHLNTTIRAVRAATQRLISNAQATVRELRSYRAALISEAVTCKLKLPA